MAFKLKPRAPRPVLVRKAKPTQPPAPQHNETASLLASPDGRYKLTVYRTKRWIVVQQRAHGVPEEVMAFASEDLAKLQVRCAELSSYARAFYVPGNPVP